MWEEEKRGLSNKQKGLIGLAVMAVLSAVTIWGSEPLYRAIKGHKRQIPEEPIYREGTYTASARGYKGDVTVTVKLSDREIKKVKITGPDETPEIGGMAIRQMPDLIWEKQSASVDGVTGATATSNAIKKALNKTLAQAVIEGTPMAESLAEAQEAEQPKKELPELEELLKTVPDGRYTYEDPEYDESGYKNKMEVFVEKGQVTEIHWDAVDQSGNGKRKLSQAGEYVMTEHGLRWFQQADQLEAYILENQSTEGLADESGYADAISSVSININGFLDALKQSLAN